MPGGSDTRELGIQVFHAFVDAKVTTVSSRYRKSGDQRSLQKARL